MNFAGVMLWGFVASIVVTGVMSLSQRLGISRMSLPFMLGTMFTPNRDRAATLGFFAHLLVGWALAFIYAGAFQSWGRASVWLGAGIGAVHATVVLVAVMPTLPAMHPRMASEHHGPEPTRQLEPPGFLGLHYGWLTPAVTLFAHILYGAVLGAFYRLG